MNSILSTKRWIYILFTMVLLQGCGGGGDNSASSITANLLGANLRLIGPISVNVNSETTFTATGGADAGYTYSIVSGEGIIDAETGIFFSGNNVGTTVIKVIDDSLNTEEIAVHTGGTALYAVGGYNGSTLDSVEISFNGVDWNFIDNALPSSHGEAAMKVFKDKLWFVGGYSNSDNVFESADGINWINNADVLPVGIDWGATAVYLGYLYYVGGDAGAVYRSNDGTTWTDLGGLYGGSIGGELFIYNDIMWFMDNGTAVWTDNLVDWHGGTLTLPASRSYHAGTVFQDKMWLIGGSSSSTNVWWSTDANDWHEGDGLTIPDSRGDGEVATFNNRMWYIGGNNGGGYTLSNLSSPDGINWEIHSDVMNTNRARYALEVFTDKTKGPTLGSLSFNNHTFTGNDIGSSAFKESNSTLFVATFGDGIQTTSNDGATWNAITIANGLSSNNIYNVFVDILDNLWAATDTGVCKSGDNGISWTCFKAVDGLASNNVFDVFLDRSNKIYAATDAGLSISSNSGVTWTNYDSSDGIAADSINDIFIDFNYTIYLATNSGLSISSDSGASWTTYSTANGIGSNIINQVTVGTSGIIFLATIGGLSISVDRASTWRNVNTEIGLPSNSISGIEVDNYGNLYASTPSSGVYISKDDTVSWTAFTTVNGLGSDSIRRICVNSSGKIYVSTSEGLGLSD